MKTIIPFFFLILLFQCNNNNSIKQNDENQEDSLQLEIIKTSKYLLSPTGAGLFSINKQLPDLKEFKYKMQDTTIMEEGIKNPYKFCNVYVSDTLLMVIDLSPANIINEISVVSPLFKTENNLGVDSQLEQLIKTYKEYEIFYSYISENFVLYNKANLNFQFIIDPKAYIADRKKLTNSDMVFLKADEFKNDAKIIKIRIFQEP